MKVGAQLSKGTPQPGGGPGSPSEIEHGPAASIVKSSDTNGGVTSSESSRSEVRFWGWFTALSLILILMAAVRWIFDHPYAVHADEAAYINQVQLDVQRLRSGHLVRLAGRLLLGDRNRPPAYRVLAIPVLALAGFHTATARLVSLSLWGMSLWFIYLTARRVGGHISGAVAVLFFLLSSEVVAASMVFGTEGALFLATSATLYFLSASWACGSELRHAWVGLGLAIGLGLLSKASFVIMLLPVLGYTFFAGRRQLGRQDVVALLKAGLLALAVAGPWWVVNVRTALGFARAAMESPRNSLGRMGFHTWAKWSNTIAQGLLGYGLTVITVLVVVGVLRKIAARREPSLNSPQRTALTACACMALPMVAVQATGVNHLLRYLTPALIPLAIIVGVLAVHVGWTHRWQYVTPLALCFALQLIMIVAPIAFPNTSPVDPGFVNGGLPWRAMARFDQWDWKPLREISLDCGSEQPRISFLGNGRAFTPSHIEYPWIVEGTRPPDVQWLWHYEEGSLEWQRVWTSVAQSDVVVTAPHYIGQVSDSQDLDNQHNAELAEQLSRDSRFRQPIRLEMGRFEPVEVLIFLKRDLVCRQAEG